MISDVNISFFFYCVNEKNIVNQPMQYLTKRLQFLLMRLCTKACYFTKVGLQLLVGKSIIPGTCDYLGLSGESGLHLVDHCKHSNRIVYYDFS